jgi:hypothetical protein
MVYAMLFIIYSTNKFQLLYHVTNTRLTNCLRIGKCSFNCHCASLRFIFRHTRFSRKPRDYILVGFTVLIIVIMKSVIYWDMMLCSPAEIDRCFEGTYCHHLQGRVINKPSMQSARSKQKAERTTLGKPGSVKCLKSSSGRIDWSKEKSKWCCSEKHNFFFLQIWTFQGQY